MANNEAIAWYVEEGQRLLEEQQRRAESLQAYVEISADEIANYLTEPFLNAPELWRVQVRSLRTVSEAIEDAQKRGNDALKSITVSLYAFVVGLAFAVLAIVVLTVELI